MTSKPNVDLSIRVDGLKAARRALNNVGKGLGKELGQAGKSAADIVARTAKSKVPVLTGKARDSVRAVVSQGGGGVRGGGASVPYYGFLDFGNKIKKGGGVGRGDTQPRPFVPGGRYIYPALEEKAGEVLDEYEQKVNELLRRAGLK